MSSHLVPFTFESHPVRVVLDGKGEPWFVAVDVCTALNHSNASVALNRLGADEKGVSDVYTPGGLQKMSTVSEAGVYRLVFTSRIAGAERFKRWLAHEVLPSIRKTGAYTAPGAAAVPRTFAQALRLAAEQQEQLEYQQAQLAKQAPKVESFERLLAAGDTLSLRDAAKAARVPERQLVARLLEDGRLFRDEAGRLRAYATECEAGRFTHRPWTAKHTEKPKAGVQVRVTTNGLSWLSSQFAAQAPSAGEVA